jgi:type III secretion system YscI/HrpB-like protein
MASVTLAFLQPAAPGASAVGDALPGVHDLQRASNFEAALARHADPQVTLVAQAAPVQPAGVVSDAAAVPSASSPDAADVRARQGLGLDGATATPTANNGDMILDGLERLRGVFDAREARVSDLMSSGSVDSRTLLAMQVEVAEFTMLVDITSKLTGKSTQIFDTLMKGQ